MGGSPKLEVERGSFKEVTETVHDIVARNGGSAWVVHEGGYRKGGLPRMSAKYCNPTAVRQGGSAREDPRLIPKGFPKECLHGDSPKLYLQGGSRKGVTQGDPKVWHRRWSSQGIRQGVSPRWVNEGGPPSGIVKGGSLRVIPTGSPMGILTADPKVGPTRG
jgi:hypothetical protein